MSGSELENIPLSSDNEEAENAKTEATTQDTKESTESTQESSQSQQYDYDRSHSWDNEVNPDVEEEKDRLIQQVLELQNTLDDLSTRVDSVKEENLKLKSENLVLGQYIENLMTASSVFQSTEPRSKRK